MIRRLFGLVGDQPPPPPPAAASTRQLERDAGRILAARAARLARQRAAANRSALIAHLASFGPFARGLDRLTQGESNV